jgi:aquaporin Z
MSTTSDFLQEPSLGAKFLAEGFGTFWLVLGGCGSAVLAAVFSNGANPLGIGFTGVALAFGLTVMTMAYAIGPISGCHLNPAVTLGLAASGRFSASNVIPYIVAQCLGGIGAAALLFWVATQRPEGLSLTGSNPFASNGFGLHSPGGYAMGACFAVEAVLTFVFLMIIHGATDKRAPKGFAPIAIGLGLTLIHLISIPVTNTSVNPARSLATALFAGPALMDQLWLFWAAPILGAIVAGVVYRTVFEAKPALLNGDRMPTIPLSTPLSTPGHYHA